MGEKRLGGESVFEGMQLGGQFFFKAMRTNSVAKFYLGILREVFFNLVPVVSVIPYFLAIGTDRQ